MNNLFYYYYRAASHQSPKPLSLKPLSLRLLRVSRVISGAAGQVWFTLLSEQDPPAATAFSCDRAVSSREGVLLSLCSPSTDAAPNSRGSKLCSALLRALGDNRWRTDAADAMLSECRTGTESAAALASPLCRVSEAISGMSWDIAVEAEEMTSGERALVGEAWGTTMGSMAWRSRARGRFGGENCGGGDGK